MKNLLAFILFMTLTLASFGQQPQAAAGTPLYSVNAKYVNGVAPGYWPTAGSGLTLNISAGTSNCIGVIISYTGGTLSMTASTTNYVYLNTASSCAPTVKTTAFTALDIPIAVVTTSGSAISTIVDDRTMLSYVGNTIINAGSSLSTAVTACSTNPTTIQITQSIAVSSGITVPANCTLLFQSGGKLTGTSITINSKIQAVSSQQIFGSGLAVTGLSGAVPFDWFGAVPYATISAAVSGTDSTATMQACLNSVTAGGWCQLDPASYRVTSALSITTSVLGIHGTTQGYSYPSASPVSIIVNTAASTDTLDVSGTSGTQIVWNTFKDFALQRSVAPTGTATGFSMSFTGGATVEHVQSEDSIRDIYLHSVPDNGVGVWRDVSVGWGYSLATGYSTTRYGWYMDSQDNNAENSLVLSHAGCSDGMSGSGTSYCYYMTGVALNDVELYNPASAGSSYGLYVNYTGTGATDSDSDIHINNPRFDACTVSCVYITSLPNAGGPSIIIDAGYLESNTANTKIVDIESSYGIAITNNQIYDIVGYSGDTGIYANASGNLNIVNNKFQDLYTGTAISLVGTIGSTISNNTISGVSTLPITTGIALSGTATGNAVVGNASNGYITTAYSFASNSLANDVGLNSCAGANITTCVSGAPTGTAPSFLAAASMVNGSLICTTAGVSGCSTGGGTTTNALTGAASGGAAPGTTFNGASAITFDYHTLGALPNLFTTIGDLEYGGTSGTPTRLAGFTVAGTYNLCETATGSAAAPTWCNSPITKAAVTSNFLTGYSATTGLFTAAQPAFSDIAGGTNTAAAMVVGTGASLGTSGSGTIAATSAPASGITGTTLASGVTGSSLTSVGTLGAGTWQATVIGATYGGTGEAGTLTGVLYGNGTSAHTVATASQLLSACTGCAPLASPTFTGTPAAPTPGTNINTTQIPTTAWVNSYYAPLISPSLTTPSLGAATATSLLATGIVDGQSPVTITTGSSATIGGTYKSGYTFNQNATAATAITYTLPTAAAGSQYCFSNSYNGSAANTGTLEILTSASGQYIIFTDGTLSATGGYVISGGAARDSACVIGVDSTHWMLYTQIGTWTKH